MEWSVPATPVLVVGDETGGVSFDGIRGVLGLPEGRWAVLDGSDQIRVVDERGLLETSIGGRGEGPGEFRFAASVRSGGGDTIGVWDPVAHRLSWFEVDAGLLEAAPIPRERLSSLVGGAGISEVMQALSSRYLLVASQGRPIEPAPGEIYRPLVDLAVLDREEARLHPLGRWGDTERTVVETARGPVSLPILNPRGFAVAASPTSPVICVGDQAAPL